METMDTNGQKISTVEEREAEQPMQKIMPRWLNNVLVMTCTAMTTVLMIIILVLLAKHFKMKALVSMLAIQNVPPPSEAVNLTAAMMSAMIAPDPAIGTKVVCAYPVAVIWQNILGYLVLVYAITQFSDQLLCVKDTNTIRSVPCIYLFMMRIMKDTAH